MYEVRRPEFPIVWILTNAAVEPRGIRARQEPTNLEIISIFPLASLLSDGRLEPLD